MRFLVDECCPRLFVDVLESAEHDVVYVSDASPSLSDEVIAQMAIAQDRLIVTQDHDFGEMAIRGGLIAPGVILVACPALAIDQRAERLERSVGELAERLFGVLAVIEAKRFRPQRVGA